MMVVIQTLLVYILLSVLMILLLKDTESKDLKSRLIFALLAYSLIFGFRYGVGRDFFGYLSIYDDILYHRISAVVDFEPGFMFIMQTLSRFGFSSTVFFFVIALLQISLVFFSQPQRAIYPFLAFTLMGTCFWLSLSNGLRQELAFCIFVYSLRFVEKERPLYHYALIALCISMHNSAWLLIIVYPLLKLRSNWFYDIFNQYVLLGLSLVLMNVGIMDGAISYGEEIAINLGYERYLDISNERYAAKLYTETSWGIGAYLLLVLNILLIFWSNKVKDYYDNKFVCYIYNLYFIGVLWSYIFNNSPILNRINYYMIGFQFIWAAYTLKYLYEQKKQPFMTMTITIILVFIGYMWNMFDNTALYIFNWQEHLFFLKREFFMT